MSSHRFDCIDAHTCGNPVRLVKSGGPVLTGNGMSEKRQHFIKEYDWIRRGLMFEPRGHDMMSGSILYPASSPENDIGVLFIETSGCLPMCGHGTIGTVTIAIEEDLVKPRSPGTLRLETPAGLVITEYKEENGKVKNVKLNNVPSYLAIDNYQTESPDLGPLNVDIAYGGNFYAIVDVQDNFPGIEHFSADQLIAWGRNLRNKLRAEIEISHPLNPTISGVSHVLWTGKPRNEASHAANAVFYGDKAIDRSPCGTGTSARMAQWYAKGKLKAGDDFIHESIIGSTFSGLIESEVEVGEYLGIVPSIQGWARITGYNTIVIDPEDDPYAHGFQVI